MNYIKSFLICKRLFVLNSVNITNIQKVNYIFQAVRALYPRRERQSFTAQPNDSS